MVVPSLEVKHSCTMTSSFPTGLEPDGSALSTGMVRETHEQRYERAGCLPALLFLRDELRRIHLPRTSVNKGEVRCLGEKFMEDSSPSSSVFPA
jgi:hypothetical protein